MLDEEATLYTISPAWPDAVASTILKDAGLVAGRRDSYWTLFRLIPGRLELIQEEMEMLLAYMSMREKGRSRRE